MNDLKLISKINRQKPRDYPVSAKNKAIPNESFKETLSEVERKQNQSEVNKTSIKKSSEIRYDLVDKFKLDLKKGSYEIKGSEIADKIIQKIRDQKNNLTL
tara:strand:+ start:895 stop:1197 length:303 start_codon:yes stop_codon:yes gene_type:complete